MIRVSKTRSKMRLLLTDLQRYWIAREGRFGRGSVRSSLTALVLWLLEGNGVKDAPFPFALPHLEFLGRCRQALGRVEAWVACPRTEPERRAVHHLSGRGRDPGHPGPPAQIRTCGTTAYGSYLG